MTTHVRLLAILVAVSSLGLSAAVAASNDTWKGAWKLEFPPPRDQPSLSYYDTNGKTVFRTAGGVQDPSSTAGGVRQSRVFHCCN